MELTVRNCLSMCYHVLCRPVVYFLRAHKKENMIAHTGCRKTQTKK